MTQSFKRGEIWRLCEDEFGDFYDVLIVSSDSWNSRNVDEVLALPVMPRSPGVSSVLDMGYLEVLFKLDAPSGSWINSSFYLVQVDGLQKVPKSDLERRWPTPPPPSIIKSVDDALRLSLAGIYDLSDDPQSDYPGPWRIQMSDLHLPSGPKPTVAVSSQEFAKASSHYMVLVCRMSSKVHPDSLHEEDVVLSSGTTKVVCSHVQSVPITDILHWRPPRKVSKELDNAERSDVVSKVHSVLHLQL